MPISLPYERANVFRLDLRGILGEAIDYLRQGQVALRPTPVPVSAPQR